MKAVIKAIVYFLIALTVIFYGGAYMLPGEVNVERSVQIAAPPEKVFTIAGNLRRLPEWSPWVELDPATTFTFGGQDQGGIGQVMRWASNNPLVGSGMQTVTEYVPASRLAVEMDYGEFGTMSSIISFTPVDGGTEVRWRFISALPGVIDRWAGLMMDRQLGGEGEKGLANLKALVEASAAGN